MGLFTRTKEKQAQALSATAAAINARQSRPSITSGIRSPWSTNTLQAVVWSDIYGSDLGAVTRADALSVPAVSRGINIIKEAAASCPLKVYAGAEEVANLPFLYATDQEIHPNLRTSLLVEDLILTGWALCVVSRDDNYEIQTMDRVAPWDWDFDSERFVVINDVRVDPTKILLFKGPTDGLMTVAARTIRGAIYTENAWTRAIKNPMAATVLRQTTDDQLEEDEVAELLANWRTARNDVDGAVAYIPYGIEIDVHGEIAPEMLVQARNAVAVSIAQHLGLPAAAIDAGVAFSSLTYQNVNGQAGLATVTQGVEPYMAAIETRLSMDDVVSPGLRVAFDRTDLYSTFENISKNGPVEND